MTRQGRCGWRRRARRGWESGVRAFHAETGGVMRLMLVTAPDAVKLTAAAGDGSALAYLRVLDTFRRRIEHLADDAPLCLTCDRSLGTDAPLLALAIPARDDATQCPAIGRCARCVGRHPDRAGAKAAVIDALCAGIWPKLRPIAAPSGTAGRV